MAITACAAKFLTHLDLLISEWANFLAINPYYTDQLLILEHRHNQKRSDRQHIWRSEHRGCSAAVSAT